MKQVLTKSGQALVEGVLTPEAEREWLLGRVHYSLVSRGTEISQIASSQATAISIVLNSRVEQGTVAT